MKNKWTWTSGEPFDIWPNGLFETEQEAIDDAVKRGYTEIYVGEAEEIGFPSIDADTIIDHLCCQMDDEAGEAADDFLRFVGKEAKEELENYVNAIIMTWAIKNNYDDEYFTVPEYKRLSLKAGESNA